jgi:hypothetical protein
MSEFDQADLDLHALFGNRALPEVARQVPATSPRTEWLAVSDGLQIGNVPSLFIGTNAKNIPRLEISVRVVGVVENEDAGASAAE